MRSPLHRLPCHSISAAASLVFVLLGASACSLIDGDGPGETAMAAPAGDVQPAASKGPPGGKPEGGELAAPRPAPRLGDVEGTEEDSRLWQGIDDVVAGGVSTGKLEVVKGGAAGTAHALHFTGNVVLKEFPFPYAGLGRPLARGKDGEAVAADLSGYKGLEFWARGDGKKYYVRLSDTEVRDYDYHHFVFTAGPAWKRFRVPFADLKQFSWGKQVPWTGKHVRDLSFTSYSEPGTAAGKIDLYVDEVALF
jgi:hypothetical protein